MALITCRKTNLSYDNRVVVSNLNFDVFQGDYLCIVGENGSGKSTLIKTLIGLKKAANGEITFGDGLKHNEIGYMPQQTEIHRDFPASVREVILSGCLNTCGMRPFFSKAEKAAVSSVMEKLNIKNLEKRCYRELSGGQQQRVLLARALCAAKKLLIMDEPVTGLDPNATYDMYDIVEKLNKNENITVIMVSHDIEAALDYATHILHVSDTPLFFGKKEDYLSSETGSIFAGKKGGNR